MKGILESRFPAFLERLKFSEVGKKVQDLPSKSQQFLRAIIANLRKLTAATVVLLLASVGVGVTGAFANTGPVVQSLTLAADNKTFFMKFDRALGGTSTAVAAYGLLKLFVNGTAITYISAGYADGPDFTTLKLVYPVVNPTQEIKFVYTAGPNNPSVNANNSPAIEEPNGTDAASFTIFLRDDVAPTPVASNPTSVSGDQISIQFNEALLTSALPPLDSLSVTQNSVPLTISSVGVSGSTLLLTLSAAPDDSAPLQIVYTAPATDNDSKTNLAIQDLAGNDAVSFTLSATVPPPDLVRPSLSTSNQISFAGSVITLRMSETLLATNPPLTSQFYVHINNVAVAVSSVSISGSTVLLTMPQSIAAGSKVAVSYDPPADNPAKTNSAIQDPSGNDALPFNAMTSPTSGVWSWDPTTSGQSVTTAQGCDGSGSRNRIKQTTLPNGVSYKVGVAGDHLCINEVTESLSQRGGEPEHFVSAGLVTEPGLKLTTSQLNCNSSLSGENLCSRGEMTIYFSQPVKNPVFSFAGLGGGQTSGNVSSLSWTEFELKTAGVTMTKLSGTNIQVVNAGKYLELVNNRPHTLCNATTNQFGAEAAAGCGSIELTGTMSSVTFEVFIGNYNGPGFLDAWNMTVNVAEDFGLVPSVMDDPVASHVVGDLRLGPTVEADQASALYGLTNPDAVNMGVSLHDNPKADDGIAAWISPAGATQSPIVNFVAGQTYSVTAEVNGTVDASYICAWIDFNRDSVFAYSERFCDDVPAGATSVPLSWTVPANVEPGLIYTRVRLSSEPIYSPLGKMNSGEVEDYSLFMPTPPENPTAPPPTVNPDTSSGPYNTSQSKVVLENDSAGSGTTLVASSVRLCGPDDIAPNCTEEAVVIANQGTYTVDTSSGVITFTPVSGFVGTATAVVYSVTDALGQTASTTYTPTVGPPSPPTASPDVSSGPYDQNQTFSPIANDAAGSAEFPLDETTLRLCDPDTTPPQSSPNCTLTTLTIANEGTYTVNTTSGVVTFDPLPTFTGAASTVNYQVSDSRGEEAFSTINVTVGPPPAPTASPDSFSDAYDTNHTYSPLVNDAVSAASFPLVSSTLRLCAVGTTTGCNLTTLIVPGEGTYSVDTSSGEVVFNPVATFVGTATPVHYEVKDSLNRPVGSTITPTVGPPEAPSAVPDAFSDAYDTNHSYTPIANDTVPASSFPLLANTVRLCAVGTTTSCNLTSLTIANEGSYTLDTTTGVVTFDPLPTFFGTATPVNYEAKDSLNRFVGSTITPTVGTPPGPTASPNVSTGGYDQNQTISPVVNDAAGSDAFPLVLTSVKLCDPSSTPPQSAPNCTLTSLTVANEGTYTVDPTTGVVTFDPLPTFTGAASTVNYQVSDTRAQVAFSTINVTVTPPIAPQATADYSTDVVNLTQVFPITTNDIAAPGLTIVTSSALLCGTGEVPFNCSQTSVTISGEGSYTLDSSGEITFVPVTDYIGNATPITYMVNDSFGQTASAQIFVVVTPTPVPLAVDDSSSDQMNRTQTLNLLTNDSSPAGYPLTPSSVLLCGLDPEETAPTCSQTVVAITGQGTLEVLNGVVTFTPETGFVGQVDEVSYVVSNSFGEKASAVIRITVTPQVIVASPPPPPRTIRRETASVVAPPPEVWPVARPDRKVGPLNKLVTLSAWLNDIRADAELDAQSIKFCDGVCSLDSQEVSYMMEKTVDEGVWSLDPNSGLIFFMPALDWHGTVSINYAIWDMAGKMAHSKVTVVIQAPVNQPVLADTGFAGGQFLASIFLMALGFGILRRNTRLSKQQSF